MHLVTRVAIAISLAWPLASYQSGSDRQEPADVPASLAFAASGGSWAQDSARGFVRVLAFAGGTEHVSSRVYLQWLQEGPDLGTVRLIRTTPVQEVNDAPVWSIGGPVFESGAATLRVRLSMTNTYDQSARSCTLTVSAPGHYRARCNPP